MTMSSTESPRENRKRQRLSKNKKKSWRKTDIQDIEEHLEDQRLQERSGGIVADKADDQLFFVDTAAVKHPQPKRRRRDWKPLRCHAGLEPDPNTKAAKETRNVKHFVLEKRCTKIQEKAQKGVISKSEKLAQSQREAALRKSEERKRQIRELPQVTQDLWGEPDTKTTEDTDFYHRKQTKQIRKPPPKHHRKKSCCVAAVEVPHPGASYNPDYNDHQELLEKAVEVEKVKEKEMLRIKRALDDAFPRGKAAPTEVTWLREMSVGMGGDDDDDDDVKKQGDETDHRLSINPPVRREDKKTEKQRRKEQERRIKEKEAALQKNVNSKRNEIYRLKSIKSSVKAQEKMLQERRQRKAARIDQTKDRPKKLGKLKFVEPDLELKLSDELVGSFRHIKPEGHLLEDRFKSLQKRNIIEPRQRTKITKKYRRKAYVKKGHKEIIA